MIYILFYTKNDMNQNEDFLFRYILSQQELFISYIYIINQTKRNQYNLSNICVRGTIVATFYLNRVVFYLFCSNLIYIFSQVSVVVRQSYLPLCSRFDADMNDNVKVIDVNCSVWE